MRLAQQATLATRPAKNHASLAELTEAWRSRAAGHLAAGHGGAGQVAWVAGLKDRNDLPLLRADDLADPILADAAEAVLSAVSERHATYGRQNLLAEAHRTLHGVRFASPHDRVTVAERITDLAVGRSLALTPPAVQHTPARYIRPDGSSRLHPAIRIAYTTQAMIGSPRSSARSSGRSLRSFRLATHATCPAPTCPAALVRQQSVSSARLAWVLSGRVARVACWAKRICSTGLGWRPWAARNVAFRSSQ